VARRVQNRSEEDQAERLDRLERSHEELLAMIAHEIRDPMTSTIGFAELLLRRHDAMTEAERNEALAAIARTGRRLVDLLEDILDVSRIEAGSLPYVMRRIDLNDVVRAVLEERRPTLDGVDVRFDAPDPAMVEGDADRLHQVVGNLVSNAVKFSLGRAPVRIATTAADGEVRLSVRDVGIGIASEDMAKLFQRFVRIPQPGDQERIPGTGLGLYISRTIVQAHRGRIWAESSPGQGSTFHVALPAA